MLVPWTRQPTGAPRIDWSNPLTKGLAYADPGQYGRNLVSGLPSTALTGTKVQTSAGGLVRGFGSTFGTGSTDANVTSLTAHATHRTYWIRVMRNGGGGGNLGRLFEKRTGGAQAELCFYDSSISLLQFGRVHSVTNGQWGAPTNSLPTGSVVAFAVTYDSTSTSNVPLMYINGAPVTVTASSSPSGTPTNNSDAYVVGNRTSDNLRNWDGWIGEFLVWDRILPPAEIAALARNPWQIFRPIVVPVKAASSGNTGTLSITLADVTLSAAGALTNRGAAAITLADVTLSAAGALTNRGAAAITLADVTLSATGSITARGVSSITLADLSLAATGESTPVGSGTASITLDDVSAAATGSLVSRGQATVTLEDLSLLASGSVTNRGEASITLADLSLSATGGEAVSTLDLILKILSNRQELDPTSGLFTIYDDDGSTVLYTAAAWEDAAGTIPYRGQALRRIDRLSI